MGSNKFFFNFREVIDELERGILFELHLIEVAGLYHFLVGIVEGLHVGVVFLYRVILFFDIDGVVGAGVVEGGLIFLDEALQEGGFLGG